MDTARKELGFTYRATSQGAVHIHRAGREVAVLRAESAVRFLAKARDATPAAIQQLCARATGNYRRGSESLASTVRRSKGRDI